MWLQHWFFAMGLSNRDYMRDLLRQSGGWQRRWWSPTGLVMAACSVVFLAQLVMTWRADSLAAAAGAPSPDHIFLIGDAAWKELRQGEWWRLLTYNFTHGGVFHFVGNLLFLWLVGRLAAQEFGPGHWTGLFFLGGVMGAAAYFSVFHRDRDVLVGASAGLYALGAATAMRMPHYQVGIPFLPGLSVRLSYVALGGVAIELISAMAQIVSLNNPEAQVVSHIRVASLAHLGGALAGFVYVKLFTDTFETMIRESERRERLYREQRQRAAVRREPTHVPVGKFTATSDSELPEPPTPTDFMEDRVNPVLEKLHAHGPASLSEEERRILEQAARRLQDGE